MENMMEQINDTFGTDYAYETTTGRYPEIVDYDLGQAVYYPTHIDAANAMRRALRLATQISASDLWRVLCSTACGVYAR